MPPIRGVGLPELVTSATDRSRHHYLSTRLLDEPQRIIERTQKLMEKLAK